MNCSTEMRDENQLKSLRPEIITDKVDFNSNERFQNETLRQILKFQHPLFVSLLKNRKEFAPVLIKEIPIEKRRIVLKQLLSKQTYLKYFLIGQICGLMTNEEFDFYLVNKQELDKRITSMLCDRILSVDLS